MAAPRSQRRFRGIEAVVGELSRLARTHQRLAALLLGKLEWDPTTDRIELGEGVSLIESTPLAGTPPRPSTSSSTVRAMPPRLISSFE